MNCFYRCLEHYGGDFLEVDGFPVWNDSPVVGRKRRAKLRPSSEAQAKYNTKCAERKLVRLIHANFTDSDYSIGLDYRDECLPTEDEEIKRDVQNFLARLRRLYAKHGAELRYICVSAHGKRGGRAHHHLIVSGGVPVEAIKAKWKLGRRHCEELQFDRDGVADLADYIIKQAEVWSKRWCASKNLVHPEPEQDDCKLSARDAFMLANRDTSPLQLYRTAAELWPEYELSSIQSCNLNELNGGAYFTLRLVRRGSKYASCDYEHWSDAWLKRSRKADRRDRIEICDGRNAAKKPKVAGQIHIEKEGRIGKQKNRC